jgi:hypothetical protein
MLTSLREIEARGSAVGKDVLLERARHERIVRRVDHVICANEKMEGGRADWIYRVEAGALPVAVRRRRVGHFQCRPSCTSAAG